MSLRTDILQARDQAMKERNTATLSTLRILYSQIKNQEIETKSELSDDAVMTVIKKQVKQLKDSIVEFRKGNREDLISAVEKELKILTAYLPEDLPDDEINGIIKETLSTLGSDTQFGVVMGAVMKNIGGRADGARVRTLLQAQLS